MFARALIVLLLVLNVGVAAWWLTRPPPVAPASIEPASGVARLQLLGEPGASVLATASALAANPSVPITAPATTAPLASLPADARCYRFGPYSNDQAAVAAQARLQPLALRVVAREQRTGRWRGWQVYLPPQPSREQADQLAQRIAAAGFSDYFVVRDGAQANSIALGRYGNEDAARRRASALGAAGFAALPEPIDGRVTTWLDVAAAPGFDAVAAQARAAAPQQHAQDCAALAELR